MVSKLREQLLKDVDGGEAYPEDTVDAMIDAILASLPPLGEPYKYDTEIMQTMCVGYNKSLRIVIEILKDAKENK